MLNCLSFVVLFSSCLKVVRLATTVSHVEPIKNLNLACASCIKQRSFTVNVFNQECFLFPGLKYREKLQVLCPYSQVNRGLTFIVLNQDQIIYFIFFRTRKPGDLKFNVSQKRTINVLAFILVGFTEYKFCDFNAFDLASKMQICISIDGVSFVHVKSVKILNYILSDLNVRGFES